MPPSLSDPSGPNVLFRVLLLSLAAPPFTLSLSYSLYFYLPPCNPARDPPIPPSPSAPRDIVTVALCLSLSLSTRSFTDIVPSPFLFLAPPCPWSPLSCQETFDLLSSSLLPFPNAHFTRSYRGTLSHLPSLLLPTPFLSYLSYYCLSGYVPLCPSYRGVVSPSHLLFVGARCLNRGLILLSPSTPTSSLSPTGFFSLPSPPSSTRDPSTFDSPRASRRRLAEIFSLLPSRNEQCGGSGMQDGRRVLEPRRDEDVASF